MTTFSSVSQRLAELSIEVPSWAYGNSWTRFKVFGSPGTPRTVEEKIADAATVHESRSYAMKRWDAKCVQEMFVRDIGQTFVRWNG